MPLTCLLTLQLGHTEAPARVLLVCTPAAFERYFAQTEAERDGGEPPEWALQPIPDAPGRRCPAARVRFSR